MSGPHRRTPGGIGDVNPTGQSAAASEGSLVERSQAPAATTGAGVSDSAATDEASQLDPAVGSTGGGVAGGGGVLRGNQPVRHIGRRPAAISTADNRPVQVVDGEVVAADGGGPYGPDDFETLPPRPEDIDPRAEKRAERMVAMLFLLSVAGTLGFLLTFIFDNLHTGDYGARMNLLLGIFLFISMFGLGAAVIVWGKKLIPHESAVQEREPFHSDPAEAQKTEDAFFAGTEQTGIARRPLLRRTAALALGVFALPGIVVFRDLGPAPKKTLRHTGWRAGVRLVNINTNEPIRPGDLRLGGLLTVMPEGYEKLPEEVYALTATVLIRLRPQDLRPIKGRTNWAVDGTVAYSAICTHAGCPVKLYEQQTQHLFCPCHQSTFDVTDGCKVLFGPAARSLPQLALRADSDGYLVAQGDYTEPVGPSFWERG